MSKKTLFEHKNVVMSAEVVGYFYNYGKKYNQCRHISCGYKNNRHRRCYYAGQGGQHGKCKADWCVVYYGKRPKDVGVAVKCSRTYFRAYTQQELANPATKVELVAVNLRVAQMWYPPVSNNVAIYNLLEDEWHSNEWWTLTGKGDVAPKSQGRLTVAPRSIAGMTEVIAKVKAGI